MESVQLQCAKNDNPSMLDDMGKNGLVMRDDSGKGIIDYVLEYSSVKVFMALIERYSYYSNFASYLTTHCRGANNRSSLENFIYLCLISNKVQLLEQKPIDVIGPHGMKSLLPAEVKDTHISSHGTRLNNGRVLTKRFFDAIADSKLVMDETFDYILAPLATRNMRADEAGGKYWVYGLPYVANSCYESRQSGRLEKVLNAMERINDVSCGVVESYNKNANGNPVWYHKCVHGNEIFVNTGLYSREEHYMCGCAPILNLTFSMAARRGNFEALKRFRAINEIVRKCGIDTYIMSDDEERMYRIDLDNSMTATQKAVQKCVHNNILNTKELMEVDDEVAVKEALDKYAIDIKEWIWDEIEAGDWPALFHFAVDQNDRALINSAMASDAEGFKNSYRALTRSPFRNNKLPAIEKSFEADVAKIKESKKSIYDEYMFKKHGPIVNYPKELFEKYYESGDYERAAIALCTRMEILFKDKYKLDGDLCEMIDEFAEKQNILPQSKDLLHTIRMYRNSIVHPTNTEDADKLKNLNVKKTVRDGIDYICLLY